NRSRCCTQKLTLGDQSRTTQCEIGVVIGDAFRDPENLRIVLLRVIKRTERVGPNSLDVPEMKELVSHEREKAAIIAFGFRCVRCCGSGAVTAANTETKARITERSRIQVFESAAGV